MESIKLGGLVLLSLTALLILRQLKPEWATFLRVATAVVAFGFILTLLGTVMCYLSELAIPAGTAVLSGEAWSILIRALGVALITEFAAAICRDSGESGLSLWVEMAGKLELLLLSFPLIRTVLDTVVTLLS